MVILEYSTSHAIAAIAVEAEFDPSVHNTSMASVQKSGRVRNTATYGEICAEVASCFLVDKQWAM